MAGPDDQQPQSPDLGAAVQLDTAETLDGPVGDGDPLDAGYVPPDRPYGLDEDAVTGAGMRDGDSLDDRLRREQPEDPAQDPDRAGRLVADGPGAGAVDVGVDGGAASAEEAAVHDIGDGEGPAETEPSPRVSDPAADAEVEAADAGSPRGDRALGDALRDVRDDGELIRDPDDDGFVPIGRHALREPAERLDAAREAGGASAAAYGRDDVGPGSGL
jgi:hypothetical protein